ncbi:MAG: PQQ-binding-like beta-propeller repeat protein [Thermodesulfobacteriota bacterium]
MLGHDHASSYTNEDEEALSTDNVHELRPLWELEARGQVYGAPVVVDGMVYASSTGGLYALDGDSGAVVWQNPDVTATSSLAWADGTLFVHDLGARLRALDAATGQEKWQTRTDTHPLATGLSSPIVFERWVVVGISSNEIVREGATFRGGVAAFDRDTGEQLWRDYTADPPANGASVWSTVAIDAEARMVFAGTGQNYTGVAGPDSDALIALDLDTGARVWTRQTVAGDVFTPINPRGPDADFGANPILFEADGRTLVGAGQKNGMFWTLDRMTGEVVWSRTLGAGSPLTGGVLNNGAFGGGGEERPVPVFVPSTYDGSFAMPLVLLLHSYSITGSFAVAAFGFEAVAEERGFLLAVPEGLRDSRGYPYWNATGGCCDFDRSGVDDSGYLRRVIEDVQARWNVDRRRIFTIGVSNGGFMGHRMACDHADLVAGIVSIAGATHLDPALCRPRDAVHILHVHGTADSVIAFEGGTFTGPYPSAPETVRRWVELNGCGDAEPGPALDADSFASGAETRVTLYRRGCRPGGTVELWEMVGADHYFFPTEEFKRVVVDWFFAHPKE